MKVVILAGGLGTRLQEETIVKPKPMVEIGGRPILWHIMNTYSSFGFKEFVIALGYKSEYIKDYFLRYQYHSQDLTIDLKTGTVEKHGTSENDWKVHLVQTGNETQTGGRIKRLKHIVGKSSFMLTYGDGVSDVNIEQLLEFHKQQKRIATLTAVRPEARFGGISFDNGSVKSFVEKPQIGEGWINGGFFVLEPQIFDYIDGDSTYFEREPMENLVKQGQLSAYKHQGFWQCMDTVRDMNLLNSLWEEGNAPWASVEKSRK